MGVCGREGPGSGSLVSMENNDNLFVLEHKKQQSTIFQAVLQIAETLTFPRSSGAGRVPWVISAQAFMRSWAMVGDTTESFL